MTVRTAAEGRLAEEAARPRVRISPFALFWALPMAVWQLLFFVAPLCFLVVMTFWIVQNFRLTPTFDLQNWREMMGAAYFWEIYFRTFLYGLLAAAVVSLALSKREALLANLSSEDQQQAGPVASARRGPVSVLAVPVLDAEGVAGLLYLDTSGSHAPFDSQHLQLVTAIAVSTRS